MGEDEQHVVIQNFIDKIKGQQMKLRDTSLEAKRKGCVFPVCNYSNHRNHYEDWYRSQNLKQ